MKRNLILYLFVLFSAVQLCHAQNDTDNIRSFKESYAKNPSYAVGYLYDEIKENPENGYSYFWLGFHESVRQNYDEALKYADQALKLMPRKDIDGKLMCRTLRADVFLMSNDKKKLLKELKAIERITPYYVYPYQIRGDLYFEEGRYDLAELEYDTVLAMSPDDVDGNVGKGRLAIVKCDYPQAIRFFSTALAHDASCAAAYYGRAEAFLASGYEENAINNLVRYIENADISKFKDDLLKKAADYDFKTLSEKLKAQFSDTDNFIWKYCLAVAYEHVGNYKEAIRYYKVIMDNDNNPLVLLLLATCYTNLGDYETAMGYLDSAPDEYNSKYKPLFLSCKASCLLASGDFDTALATVNECLGMAESARLYQMLAMIQYETGDYVMAVESCDFALVLMPDAGELNYLRGTCYEAKGDRKAAESDYKKALKKLPVGNAMVALVYARLGMKDNAIEYMNDVIADFPAKNELFFTAACMYCLLDEPQLALDNLRTAFEKGYQNVGMIDYYDELDSIRNLPEFEAIVGLHRIKKNTETTDKNEKNNTIA